MRKKKIKDSFQNIPHRQRVGKQFCYGIMQEFLSCLVKLRWPSPKKRQPFSMNKKADPNTFSRVNPKIIFILVTLFKWNS